MSKRNFRILVGVGIFSCVLFLVVDAAARGRGGRGGGGGRSRPNVSRGGAASHGSLPGRGGAYQSPSRSRGSYDRGSAGGRYGSRPNTGRTDPSRQPQRRDPGAEGRTQRRGEGRPEQGERRLDDEQRGELREGVGDRENREDWQDYGRERQEDRQKEANKLQEDRQEYYEDHASEWYEDSWHYGVGTSITVINFNSLGCTPTTVIVSGTTYYQCGSTWYNRAYSGGSVNYIVVNAPTGH